MDRSEGAPAHETQAETFRRLSPKAWRKALWDSWQEASNDNIALISAGVAFYAFLALVPLLGAVVLTYGLVADPDTVVRDMKALTSVMPPDASHFVGQQLMEVVQTSSGKKGFGAIFALALALFAARNGAGSIITALNIAYEVKERRSYILVTLLAIGTTGLAVLTVIVAMVAITALGHLQRLVPGAPIVLLVLGKLTTYGILGLSGTAASAILYRYGPSRRHARWVWLNPGSLLASVCWMLLALGFGVYVARFGNYSATYGSLSAPVVLLTWLYLSIYVLLFGAELNCELQRHATPREAE
ncbi:YihY/virulence factor BrkB family protein [Novosphingobium rosa]|uniref:YihY/virulence factor BrkB family protein n=1 Tax=Novosphingobium rosa TaxID=76978 RepID=UPI0008379795|nr:YihY/virulence factor BrkB family protein [Novosphingobium rosa]